MNDIAHMIDQEDTGYRAYLEGRQARRAGKPQVVNPYGKGNHESREFDRGYMVEETAQRVLGAH